MSNIRKVYSSRTADKFVVRFPEGMRGNVQKACVENNRSMNSEIISRLEASFETEHASDIQQQTCPYVGQFLVLKDTTQELSVFEGDVFSLQAIFTNHEGVLCFIVATSSGCQITVPAKNCKPFKYFFG